MGFISDVTVGKNAENIFWWFEGQFSKYNVLSPLKTGDSRIEGKDVSEEVQELFNAFNDMSLRLNLYDEKNIEQLTLERNKLEAVLMSIVNGVVVCDENDKVVLLNNHAKELLELQGDQLLGTDIHNYVDTQGEYCFNEKIDEYKELSLEEIEREYKKTKEKNGQ